MRKRFCKATNHKVKQWRRFTGWDTAEDLDGRSYSVTVSMKACLCGEAIYVQDPVWG